MARNDADLPAGFVKIGGRKVHDTGVMNFGFNFPTDPAVERLRDIVRGERVKSDCDLLVALVTGKTHIRARHWMLRNRVREVRAPWWFLPKYKRAFHGQTPWWVRRRRRQSFCAMVQVNGMSDLTALTVMLLEQQRFTVRQLELFMGRTPLLAEVAARFAAARTEYTRSIDRVPAEEATINELLAILQDDPITWLRHADDIHAAATSGLIRNLYNDHRVTEKIVGELIHQRLITDLLEPARPTLPTGRRRLNTAHSRVDTAELTKFVGDGSNLRVESGGR